MLNFSVCTLCLNKSDLISKSSGPEDTWRVAWLLILVLGPRGIVRALKIARKLNSEIWGGWCHLSVPRFPLFPPPPCCVPWRLIHMAWVNGLPWALAGSWVPPTGRNQRVGREGGWNICSLAPSLCFLYWRPQLLRRTSPMASFSRFW